MEVDGKERKNNPYTFSPPYIYIHEMRGCLGFGETCSNLCFTPSNTGFVPLIIIFFFSK